MFIDRRSAVIEMLGVFGEQRQLRIGWQLDDNASPARHFDIAGLSVPFSIEVQRRQQAEREKDQPRRYQAGYEIAHSKSPVK